MFGFFAEFSKSYPKKRRPYIKNLVVMAAIHSALSAKAVAQLDIKLRKPVSKLSLSRKSAVCKAVESPAVPKIAKDVTEVSYTDGWL